MEAAITKEPWKLPAALLSRPKRTVHYDTYNFYPRTGVLNSIDLDLISISRAQIDNASAQAGIVQSSANGVVVGTTVRSSFSQEISPAGLGAGPHAAVLGFFNQDVILDIAITNPGNAWNSHRSLWR
ncbi:MAG: hypothetical protein MPW15_20505 [Candidatus Manganitrophus sp.]|nr:hypothetical protein [Candidatus Manganitrophus sp.]